MNVRCKFVCDEVATQNWPLCSPDGKVVGKAQKIALSAQYDDGISKENAGYASATPDGKMNFTVTNLAVHGLFEPGKKYFITITEAPD